MRSFPVLVALAICHGLSLAPLPLMAAETAESGEVWPALKVKTKIELQHDHLAGAGKITDASNNFKAKIETEAEARLYSFGGLFAGFNIHQIDKPPKGDDGFLHGHGLIMEQLYVFADVGPARLIAGKFNPHFAIGYDVAPGLYGHDVLERQVELTEMTGLGARFTLGSIGLEGHEFSVSAFMRDRTLLSGSTITNRGRNDISDGGPANHDGLESFVAALDGPVGAFGPGWRYHIGLQHLGGADAGAAGESQSGLVAALEGAFSPGDVTLVPLVELVVYDDFAGVQDQRRLVTTAGLDAQLGKWNASLVHSWLGDRDKKRADRHVAQLSAGYKFASGFYAQAGGEMVTKSGEGPKWTLGLRLTRKFAFKVK